MIYSSNIPTSDMYLYRKLKLDTIIIIIAVVTP